MKKFLVICVALIAFAATNASGTNYQPTDQLQTHFIVQQHNPFMPVMAVNFEPATADVIYGYTAKLRTNNVVGLTAKPDAYTLMDPGREANLIALSANIKSLVTNKHPLWELTYTADNYNVNHSYGLRY